MNTTLAPTPVAKEAPITNAKAMPTFDPSVGAAMIKRNEYFASKWKTKKLVKIELLCHIKTGPSKSRSFFIAFLFTGEFLYKMQTFLRKSHISDI